MWKAVLSMLWSTGCAEARKDGIDTAVATVVEDGENDNFGAAVVRMAKEHFGGRS